jgi:general secretion pathway protein G
VLQENLAAVRDAIDQYHADKGKWPDSIDSLATARYLRAVPIDPITDSAETWITVPPPDGEGGVYDIRSGAEGTGSNGQAYAEW